MLSPSGQEERQSEQLGDAAVGGVRCFSPEGTALALSDGLALQRHHHITTQFLSQGPAILDVVQPVYLPLVLDACKRGFVRVVSNVRYAPDLQHD